MIVRRQAICVLLLVTIACIDFTTSTSESTSTSNTGSATKISRTSTINAPITTIMPDDLNRQIIESAHGYYDDYHTDRLVSEPTSRRTSATTGRQQQQQQEPHGMLILQDGVLIFVPLPPPQQGDSDQRSHGEGGGGDGGGYHGDNNDEVYTDDNDRYEHYNNDETMLRPQDDDEFFQGLDCSQFGALDDPPIECLQAYPGGSPEYGYVNHTNNTDDQFPDNGDALRPQNPETGDNNTMATGMVDSTFTGDYGGGVTDSDSDSYDDDGYTQEGSPRYPPENLVSVQIGVAMSPPPSNLDPINHVISEVVTAVLDAHTSFHSVYLGNLNPPVDYRQRQLTDRTQLSTEHTTARPSRHLESYSKNENQPHPTSSTGASAKHPPVDLIHAWTIIEPTTLVTDSDSNSSMVWYWASIDYAALIGSPEGDSTPQSSLPPPRPIRREDHIGNITLICQKTMNRTIANDVLLYRLVDSIEAFLEHGSDGHSEDFDFRREQLGLVAIAPIGETGFGQPYYVSDLKDRSHVSFTTPLDLEFGLREWLGLALGFGTALVTILLFGGAAYYHQRQGQKQWSTALMTEHGINDILKVGWQYHQQTAVTMNGLPSQSQPQLFLHVFEKQGFRSDDDSLLHGGVERDEIARTGGILLVHDEGSREDDSSSSNRHSSSRASAEQTQPTTPTSRWHV